MKILDYIQLSLTLFLAVWNFILQYQLRRLEPRNKLNERKTTKITEYEYTSYRAVWDLLVVVLDKVRGLRAYPKNLDSNNDQATNNIDINNYADALKKLKHALRANSPYMQKSICDIIWQILKLGKLEQLQTLSTGKELHAKHMNQAIENIQRMKILFDTAENELRKIIMAK